MALARRAGDRSPGVMMTSGEYKAFDRAQEANTDRKKLIEAGGLVSSGA
jgi:hypothetical protein